MMSLGTGYFDKITFSEMGQLNSKKLKVIFFFFFFFNIEVF